MSNARELAELGLELDVTGDNVTFGNGNGEGVRLAVNENGGEVDLLNNAGSIRGLIDFLDGDDDGEGVMRFLNLSTSDGGIQIGVAAANTTGSISFITNNAQRMFIEGGGVVNINDHLRIGTNDVSDYQGISIRNARDSSVTTNTSFVDAQNNLGIPDSHVFFQHNTDGSSEIIMGTTLAGDRSTDRRGERLRISSNGYIGVGTSSPTALHHVRDGNLNGLNKHAAIITDDSNDGNNGGLLINSYQPRLTLNDSSGNAKWYDFKVNGNVLDFGVGANTNQHVRHHNLLQLNEYGHLQAREGFTSDKDNSKSRQAYKMYDVNPYTVNNGGTYVRNYVRLFTMPSDGQAEVQFWLNHQGDHNYSHVFIAYCQIHQWYSSAGNYNYRISSLESNLTGTFKFDSNKGVWWKPSGLWSHTTRMHVITHNSVTIDCDTYSQNPGGTARSITGLTAISGEHTWGS